MERITKNRGIALFIIVCLILGFYTLRLYKLQVVETKGVKNSVTTYTTWTRVKAARGDILDRNGNVMVSNRASYDLVFNHYVLQSSDTPNESIYNLLKLCRELGIEYTDHFPVTKERPFAYIMDDFSATWKGYFMSFLYNRGPWDSDISAPLLVSTLRSYYGIPETWSDEDARMVIGLRYELSLRTVTTLPNYVLLEDAPEDVLSAILELNTPGLNVEASTVREYHTKYAAHILGYCGPMTPEQWEQYAPLGYAMDAEVGQSGFEAAFEDYLHGIDGVRIDEVLSDGTVVSSEYITEPQSGNHVQVTIDLPLQEAAEVAMAEQWAYLTDVTKNLYDGGWDADGLAVVAMDNKTGQVLVCASYPTYNLETFFDDYDTLLEAKGNPLYNRALLASYPPGSVYKVSAAIAGLQYGAISSGSIITDEGVFQKYDGFSPACMVWNDRGYTHGDLDVTGALMVSCNYFFYEVGDRLTIEQLDDTAKSLGLGEKTGVELYEITGHRSNREVKRELYTDSAAEWYTGDRILTAIGQSENSFTPIQLAVYTSTVANKGVRMKATFLNQVVSTDYRSRLEKSVPQQVGTCEISDDTYNAIIEGMTKVVYETGGTLDDTVMHNYPVDVCGKTGTSDHTGAGSANGALILFGPTQDPTISIALYGEHIAHGPNLAPIAKAVLDVYFGSDNVSIGEVGVAENKLS